MGYGSERCLLSEVCDCEASQDRRLPSQLLLLVVLLWLQSLDLVDGVVARVSLVLFATRGLRRCLERRPVVPHRYE